MKKMLLEISTIDKQSEIAARRIGKVLALDVVDGGPSAMSDVSALLHTIKELQRENLCLKFAASNDTDLDELYSTEQSNIRNLLVSGSPYRNLCSRFDFNYFSEYHDPDYIVKICTFLIDACQNSNVEPSNIWLYLVASNGIITKEINDYFGHVEVDKGLV